MPRNRTKIGLLALVLAVLAGVALWIVLSPRPSPPLPEARTNGTHKEVARDASSATNTDHADGQEHLESAETPPVTEQVSAPEEPAPSDQDDPTIELIRPLAKVTIYVVDEAGQPIVGLLMSYDVFPDRPEESTPVQVTRESLSHSALTDTRGAFTLTGPPVGFVALAAPVGWAILPEAGREREVDSAEMSFRFGGYKAGPGIRAFAGHGNLEVSHTVRCMALSTMPVRVRYDDGRPGEGTINFAQWTDRSGEPAGILVFADRGLELDANGEVQVPILPEVGHLGVGVFSNRPGWRREVRLRKDVAGLTDFEVVIPAEQGVGYLRLNVSGLEPDESVRIEVRSQFGFHHGEFDGVGNGSYLSTRIFFGARVRVYATGDRAWLSQEIQLDSSLLNSRGEMEIDVLPTAPSMVTLTAVDSAGAPVLPAVLIRDVWGSVPGFRPRRFLEVRSEEVYSAGTFATADETGLIRYEGLAAGEHSLLLLAKGYEARVVHYSVAPGGTADLGTVTLRKYVGDEGVVRLRLVGTTDFEDFRGTVDSGLAPGGMSDVRFDERGVAEFRDLYYRRYMISARRVSDRAIWQKQIELSPDNPTADVEFDVSQASPR
jgi:hypothetical protein